MASVSWGFQRVYLEGGSDAHSGFGDFDDCDGFDGGTRSGPDVRSGLSSLPACLPAVGGQLLRMPLHVAASVQRVGIGPRRPVRHQSIFCERANIRGTTLPAVSPGLLDVLRLAVPRMSGVGRKAENICSQRVFRLL